MTRIMMGQGDVNCCRPLLDWVGDVFMQTVGTIVLII